MGTRLGRFPPRTACAKGVADVILGAPTPDVTLARDTDPALPTPTVTLVSDAPEPAVPTPTGGTLRRCGVGSDDSGEGGVFRLAPTPAADGMGVLVRVNGVQGE